MLDHGKHKISLFVMSALTGILLLDYSSGHRFRSCQQLCGEFIQSPYVKYKQETPRIFVEDRITGRFVGIKWETSDGDKVGNSVGTEEGEYWVDPEKPWIRHYTKIARHDYSENSTKNTFGIKLGI